jgi:uncharacterized membrane protein (DUF373 family)
LRKNATALRFPDALARWAGSTAFDRWNRTKEEWYALTYYQRFESAVAFVLTLLIALIVLVALYRLSVAVVSALLFGALDPLEHGVFQTVFGQIMTLLIALEFNHTLRHFVTRHQSIIQTRVVILIALLALARKFIIFDIHDTPPAYLMGLAGVTLALAATYWLIRERDQEDDEDA